MFVDSPLKIPGCRLIIGLLYKYLQQCKKVLLIHSWVFMDALVRLTIGKTYIINLQVLYLYPPK